MREWNEKGRPLGRPFHVSPTAIAIIPRTVPKYS